MTVNICLAWVKTVLGRLNNLSPWLLKMPRIYIKLICLGMHWVWVLENVAFVWMSLWLSLEGGHGWMNEKERRNGEEVPKSCFLSHCHKIHTYIWKLKLYMLFTLILMSMIENLLHPPLFLGVPSWGEKTGTKELTQSKTVIKRSVGWSVTMRMISVWAVVVGKSLQRNGCCDLIRWMERIMSRRTQKKKKKQT